MDRAGTAEATARTLTTGGFLVPLLLCAGTVTTFSGCARRAADPTVQIYADAGFLNSANGGTVPITFHTALPGPTAEYVAQIPADPWLWLIPLVTLLGLVAVVLSRNHLAASVSLAYLAVGGFVAAAAAAVEAPTSAAVTPSLAIDGTGTNIEDPLQSFFVLFRFAPWYAVAFVAALVTTLRHTERVGAHKARDALAISEFGTARAVVTPVRRAEL